MKNQLKLRSVFLVFLGVFILSTGFHDLSAQNVKKNKVRLKADYVKIMNKEIYFDIRATSKIGESNINVSNIDITVYNEFDDENIKLGSATTNMKGENRFVVNDFSSIKPDSTNTYHILISFKGNDDFGKASKRISFKNADITSKLITIHGVDYITSSLKDSSKDSLISDVSITVQIERLFQPLFIGDEFNITDEYGTISVPIEKGIPGIDGNLIIEVVLDANDDYGTVKDIVIAPVGTVIVDESTFDDRTMWSPRNKTPLFLLIFPNLLIFGMWGLIIYLFFNLYKISKTKNENNENI